MNLPIKIDKTDFRNLGTYGRAEIVADKCNEIIDFLSTLGDKKCRNEKGYLVCYCGKCEPENYPLPKDFPLSHTEHMLSPEILSIKTGEINSKLVENRTPCCDAPFFTSVSTKKGRQKLCNCCGEDYTIPRYTKSDILNSLN